MSALWANNQGGHDGDAAVEVRRERRDDIEKVSAKWGRLNGRHPGHSEEQIEADLLASLGLSEDDSQ